MVPKSALDTLWHRILKRPYGDVNQNPEPEGSREPKFSSTPEASAPEVEPSKTAAEVQPSKKQKGKKAAKEVIQVDIEDNQPSGRLEDNVFDRTFPYPEFMDKSLVTPTVLDQIRNDPDGFVDRFQWASRTLLKAATILRCSKPVVSIDIQASREVKDLGESIRLLKVEKLALEEAKEKLSSDFEELKEASPTKDHRLEEKDHKLEKTKSKISELEKSNAEASDEIARLKADVAFIEQ